MADPVVHFELPADDVARAQAFYANCFGWRAQSIPGMGYTLWQTAPTNPQGMPAEPGAINGGMYPRPAFVRGPVLIVKVADMSRALAEVQRNGGKVVRQALPVPGVGLAAYVEDTEGNVVGLMQPAPRPA